MNMDNKKTFTLRSEKQIKVYNTLINAMCALMSAAEKFNGKVINKRFVDAMNKEFKKPEHHCESVTIWMEDNSFYHGGEKRIKFYCDDRWSQEGNCYVEDNDVLIYSRYEVDHTVPYISYNDGNRLNYEEMRKAVQSMVDELQRRITAYRTSIDKFDYFKDKFKQFSKDYDKLMAEMPIYLHPKTTSLYWGFYD